MGRGLAGRGGFTLIETLIALAIFAGAGATLFALAGSGLDRQGRAENLTRATALAESLLARLGQDIPLQPGQLRGQSPDRIDWRLDLRASAPGTETQPVRLVDVELVVTWMEGLHERRLRLATRRLATAPS